MFVIKRFISTREFVSYLKELYHLQRLVIKWDMVGWWNDEFGEICKEMVIALWVNALTFCWRKWEITWRIHSQGNELLSADVWMNGGLFNYFVSNEAVLLHQMMWEYNSSNWTWKHGVMANLKVLSQHSPEGTEKNYKNPSVMRTDVTTSTWTGILPPSHTTNEGQKYYC